METFSLADCAIELLQVADKKGVLQGFDNRLFFDLLVPPVEGKIVTYQQYYEIWDRVRKIPLDTRIML